MLDDVLNWIQIAGTLPRGEAMHWPSAMLALDFTFNLTIALSYVALVGLLRPLVQQRPELHQHPLVRVFGFVVLTSAVCHLHQIWTLWFAHYPLGLLLQGALAIGVVTAVVGLRSRVSTLARLAPPEEFAELQHRLSDAQDQRQRAQNEMLALHRSLDQQVRQRTDHLEEQNRQLQTQIQSLRNAEREFLNEKERALVTLRAIADGVIATDTHARVTYLNPVAERITGWSSAEAIGRLISEIFKRTDENTHGHTPDPVDTVLEQGELSALPSQSRLINRYGQTYSVEDLATPIRDRDGSLAGVVLVFHDVSAARKMANRMSHLAQHDQLTGLPNRLLLHDRLNRAISQARRHRDRVALLYLDLDRFKQINDNLGHQIGDKLLKETARRLEKCVRASDTVSRQGGDEFVILLPQVSDSMAPAEVARKILASIGEPFQIDSETLEMTVSVGIAVFPDDGTNIDALTRSADSAMYHAKSLGRDNFQFFTSNVNQKLGERRAIERRMRLALDRGEFELLYQPKISLTNGGITGAEALLRWNHPQHGQIGPEKFMTSAEDSGLIVPIGQWVLKQVCAQSRLWSEQGLQSFPISINLSSSQLAERNFLNDITPILTDAQLPSGAIEFELREEAACPSRRPTLERLHGMGIALSIDDFGAGETSVSALRKLPFDTVKLDGQLVRGAITDPEHAALLSGLIEISQKLKKKVVGKGIENHSQLQLLRTQGCLEGQGYLFGKPLSASDFQQMLNLQQPKTVSTHQAH